MIPFLTATYLRLGLAVGAVALVALMGWRVSAWHGAYKALPGVQDALAAEEACLPPSKCGARLAALQAATERASKEVVNEYERDLADLRNRPIPVRTVRLCPDRSRLPGAVPAGTADGPGTGAAVVLCWIISIGR